MKLTLGWLYPELMSTYGDYGNLLVLKKRCLWRQIDFEIRRLEFSDWQLPVDLLFMGGAQDIQQAIVSRDFAKNHHQKTQQLREAINAGTPGLFICGAYQFLGAYYKAADGQKIPGLGIMDHYTEHPGFAAKRLIGNVAVRTDLTGDDLTLVGFENHGGRTILGENTVSFARILKGFGNNGRDGNEGAVFKNAVGTYLHGPFLSKNPEIADWFIKNALERKYQHKVKLGTLDDRLEKQARTVFLKKLL